MTRKLLSVLTFLMLLGGISTSAQQTAKFKNAVNVSQNLGMVSSVKNGEVIIPVSIENCGTKTIESLDLKVTVNGVETDCVVMPGYAALESGKTSVVNVKITSPSVTGIHDVRVYVDKVNGSDNELVQEAAEGSMVTLTRNVTHKVFFEEFTGMTCGNCPRGQVALEKARRLYGNDIVLVSAHFGDPINCREYNLIQENQLPSAHLDRNIMHVDPYFGTNTKKLFGIEDDIKKCAAIAPVAEVNVNAVIEGDNLIATSDVKFLYTGKGNFAVGYVVTEDGMKNEKWGQANNYAQFKGMGFMEETDPDMQVWFNGDKRVVGCVFNDVAIVADGILKGIEGSMPESFTEEVSYTHEKEFNLKKLKKMQNRKNLNVCVFLYDRDKGLIVNSNFMSFEHETAIEGVEADDENVIEVARYTTDGQRIDAPQSGINIVKYSDGSIKKVIVK